MLALLAAVAVHCFRRGGGLEPSSKRHLTWALFSGGSRDAHTPLSVPSHSPVPSPMRQAQCSMLFHNRVRVSRGLAGGRCPLLLGWDDAVSPHVGLLRMQNDVASVARKQQQQQPQGLSLAGDVCGIFGDVAAWVSVSVDLAWC